MADTAAAPAAAPALPSTIRSVGIKSNGGPEVLTELSLDFAAPTGRDLAVKIFATALNPVDVKVRSGGMGAIEEGAQRVIGWDASGVVVAAGPDAELFKVGDEVFYAGDLTKAGTYSQFHVVDERIVGHKPKSISHNDAAALPLTSLTAFEVLYEGMAVPIKGETPDDALTHETTEPIVLIVGGAGGVGSIAIQMVRALTPGATVVATASRPETEAFCKKLGAHHVINHHKDLKEQLKALELPGAHYVFVTVDLEKAYEAAADLLLPLGAIGTITHGADTSKIDPTKLFAKRGRLVWELMFTRSLFGVRPLRQHNALNRVAALVDEGKIQTTATSNVPFSVEAIQKAHAFSATGKAIGKATFSLDGF